MIRTARALTNFVAIALLGLSAALPLEVAGQGGSTAPTIETQTPVAESVGVVEISPALRDRLGLFPGVDGFTSARLFLQTNGVTLLEIESRTGGVLRRERRTLSAGELDELRTLVASRLGEAGGTAAFTRDGRGKLVLTQTLLGLGFYGWAVPYVFDLETAQAAVGTYLLTAGATFYLPYRLTRNRSVSRAHADLTFYGSTRGALSGLLLSSAAFSDDTSSRDRKRVAGTLLGSVAGSILGFAAVDHFNPTEGRAALWGAMGDFGFAGGAALAYLAGPYGWEDIVVDDGPVPYTVEQRKNPELGHIITVAGGAAGLLLGRRIGGPNLTEGNVGGLRSAGILGAQVGLTAAQALGIEQERVDWDVVVVEDDVRALAAGGLLGGIAGIYLGNRLLEDKRYTMGVGLLINAGHLAGAATALGLTYLAVEEVEDNKLLYLTTGTLGSFVGAGLVYRSIGTGTATLATTGGSRGREGISVALRPENLLLSLQRSDRETLPLVRIRF